MRRLSIIDLQTGHQPIHNEDRTLWIVFNGEVYNFAELRADLEARDHKFLTNTDTEVIVHLYEEMKCDVVKKLNGMFAFAIWDAREKELFIARDRLGIKPLYYWEGPEYFLFASELKSILQDPSVSRTVHFPALSHYMTLLYVPGEDSIIKGVKRLLPGHWLRLKNGKITIEQYWDIKFSPTLHSPEEEYCENIRMLLKKSVKRRLISDVPVGVLLSGGIDSSSIVGIASELAGDKLKTFSLGFTGENEEEWNELPLARIVADRYKTDHSELALSPPKLMDDLLDMVWHLDEPYAGGLPSYYVFKFMRRRVTVGLSGMGGDELFGNYGKYLTYLTSRPAQLGLMYNNFSPARRKIFNLLLRLPLEILGKDRARKAREIPLYSRNLANLFYLRVWYYFAEEIKREMFSGAMSDMIDSAADTADYLEKLYATSNSKDIINKICYTDLKTQFTDEFLFFTDRLSMCSSLEARVPFMDHELVEYVCRIPGSVRSHPDDIKYLLKKAVRDIVPPENLNAPKRGFVIPIKLWLKGEFKNLLLSLADRRRLLEQGYFDPDFIHDYIRRFLSGELECAWQLWAFLMFQLWHVVYIEKGCTRIPDFTIRELETIHG
jgi:asparagine synthase (glutamine-hydrolysing)